MPVLIRKTDAWGVQALLEIVILECVFGCFGNILTRFGKI